MVNVSRKGGKLDPKWQGPYIILDIDRQGRVLLQDVKTKKTLKIIIPLLFGGGLVTI